MQTSAVRAIVTGGLSGLGLATVKHILAKGGRVVAIDLPRAVGAWKQDPIPNLSIVAADVTNAAEVTILSKYF
jgi:NAD(P)-dependent dehydrogenase (short-subunit alcohol dehydrogenase family)